jgi:hypothetical protein
MILTIWTNDVLILRSEETVRRRVPYISYLSKIIQLPVSTSPEILHIDVAEPNQKFFRHILSHKLIEPFDCIERYRFLIADLAELS